MSQAAVDPVDRPERSAHAHHLLGRSEVIGGRSAAFEAVDLKNRVFAPVERRTDFRDRLLTLMRGDGDENDGATIQLTERLRETGFELSPVAQIVVQSGRRSGGTCSHSRSGSRSRSCASRSCAVSKTERIKR